MPFRSRAQQKFMFSAEARGDLPPGTAERWAEHTPDIKHLPERVHPKKKKPGHKKVAFMHGVKKTIGKLGPEAYDKAGLALLATVPAYHAFKGLKNNNKEDVATSAAELGGLGLLYHAVRKAHT